MIWNRLFTKATSIEKGTLLQLKNLIGRSNVPTTPKKNVNACEDFLDVIIKGYILAAAKEIEELQGCMASSMSIEERHDWFYLGIQKFIKKYVHDSISFSATPSQDVNDGLMNYGTQVIYQFGAALHGIY